MGSDDGYSSQPHAQWSSLPKILLMPGGSQKVSIVCFSCISGNIQSCNTRPCYYLTLRKLTVLLKTNPLVVVIKMVWEKSVRQEFPEVLFLWSLWIAWAIHFPQASAADCWWKENIVMCRFLLGPVQQPCPQISCLLRVTGCFKWSKLIWASNLFFKCSMFHDCNTQFSGCVNDDYIQWGQNSKESSKRNTGGEWRMCGKNQYFAARKHQ